MALEHFKAWQHLDIEAGKRLTLMSAVPKEEEEEDTLQLQLTTDMGVHVIMNCYCPGSIDQPGFFYIECNQPWTTYLNDWAGHGRLFEDVLTKMTQLMEKFVEVKPLAVKESPLPTKLVGAFSEGDI